MSANLAVSQPEIETEAHPDTTPEIDPIEVIHEGECPSLSGRSVITYAIGRHTEDGSLHLAITDNSGGGMWCKDWGSAEAINEVVVGASELKAKSFHVLHQGKSINTGGFVLAALKAMGLIRVNEENTRLHGHVPTTTFQQRAMACMGETAEVKPKAVRKKVKGAQIEPINY